LPGIVAVVPVKRLELAKMRLSAVIPPEPRKELAFRMLSSVLQALENSSLTSTIIVTSDAKVLSWAKSRGIETVAEDGLGGPNTAVSKGVQRAIRDGRDACMVVAMDLPLLSSEDIDLCIEMASPFDRCVVASGSHRGGTNLLLLKPPGVIKTMFGDNSFMKHIEESEKARVPFLEYRSERAMLDVDTVEDLCRAMDMGLDQGYSFVRQYLPRHTQEE